MARNWKSEILQTVVQCLFGSIVLGLVTFACFHLELKVAVSAFAYLTVIVLLSLRVNFAASILLLFAALACLVYFFAAPIFNFQIELGRDAAVIGSFLLTAFIVSSLVARARNQTQEALQAAEALRRSEAYLEEGQRLTHTGSWAWNVATRENVYWSPEHFRIFGLDPSRDTLSFAGAIQRIEPEDLARMMQALDAAILEKRDFEVDWRISLPNGNVRHVHSVGHPVIEKNGEVTEFVGTLVDITDQYHAATALERENAERRRAEDDLRLSETYLHEAQRLGRMGSWSYNIDSETLHASPELLRIFDLDPGRRKLSMGVLLEKVHPADRPFVAQELQKGRIPETNFEIIPLDYRIIRPDGAIKHIHSVAHAVINASRNLVEHVGIIMDVTERTLAEMKLKQSEAFLAEAQRVSHTGSFAYKRTNGEVVWSDETYRIFELEPGASPTIERSLQRVHPEDQAFAQMRHDEAAGGGAPNREGEYRLLMQDGRIKHVRTLRGPAGSECADLFSVIGTVMDVTERKQAEEALRKAQADLAHASRVSLMGELAATLAHEVNQPITAAVTNANTGLRWLNRDVPDLEEARAAIGRIVDDGTRAAEIISRTRAFFKKGVAERELTDVDEVVRQTILLLRSETTRHSISVRTFLAAGFPEVMGDRVQLQQVVMNLIMNSIDALKDVDGVRELVVRSQRTGEGEIAVSVSDTGVGLPSQHSDQIFNAFVTTKPSGTGMGLSISRTIVEAHGGQLSAAPNTPRGAVFRFTLPIENCASGA
jgi:signal transduction histidine kinase